MFYGIKSDGTLLSKTDEVKVISTATQIDGSDFPDASAFNFYKGVFINGRIVTLSPFYMAKYQVTQELYKAVMTGQKVTVDGTEYTLDAVPSLCTQDSTKYVLLDDESAEYCPVENVSWFDAVYFCNVLSEKLGLTKAYAIEITEVSENHITAATVEPVENANGYRLPTEAEWKFAARGRFTPTTHVFLTGAPAAMKAIAMTWASAFVAPL